MSIVDLAGIPRLLDPQLAPDGQSVIYMLTRADWQANRAVGQIWRQAVSGGAPVQLTTQDGGAASARWSPDGRTMAFVARGSDGTQQLFVQPVDGGAARVVTHHATSVSQPSWAPDSAALYFVASDERSAEARERDRVRDDVYAFDENYSQRHLWKVSVSAGGPVADAVRITGGNFSVVSYSSVTSYKLSRDGSRIVTHRAPTPLAADSSRSEVWVSAADGSAARVVTTNGIEETDVELSPDNSRVLFVAEASDALQPYHSARVFVAPVSGGPPRPLARDVSYALERAAWSPDGRSVLAVANMGVHSEIVRIDVASGKTEVLTSGQHSVQFWSLTPQAGRMVFQLDEPDRFGDAWTLAVAGGRPQRVTGVYDRLARDFALPRQARVEWRGADGTALEGLVFYPVGYQAGQRYPLVVQLHGGPAESDKFGYGPGVIVNYVPVLAARGYAVFRPNYRGSTGYGDAFLRDVIGGYFRNMPLDVLAGVDRLIAMGVADEDRLAVMGWSAGGHLTNRLITVTGRFKAAASTAGAANWISLFAQTDARSDRALWFGGMPWQAGAPFERYWRESPLSGVSAVTTPTLFLVGEGDPRVPMAQSVEMYRALRSNGVPTWLLVAPREGHQWAELRHQLHKANAELEWFERHVRGQGYTWETAPEQAPAGAPGL
jgi:dipeptidyl aminopeptidase/acylaminoacyl peptidase